MHPGAAIAGLAGETVAVSPYLFAFGRALGIADQPGWNWQLGAGCLAMAAGGLALNARRIWDQWILTVGVGLTLVALTPLLTDRPALTLALSLLAISLVFDAWESDRPFPVRSRETIPSRESLAGAAARRAVGIATIAQFAFALSLGESEAGIRFAGLAAAALFSLRWSRSAWDVRRGRAVGVVAAATLAPALFWSVGPIPAHLLLAGVVLLTIPAGEREGLGGGLLESVIHHPAGPLVVSFFLLCAGGAVLLHLPAATRVEGGISTIDAIFTAVSAVCVTGLVVLNTGADFTPLGQVLILALIQLGALGIMSYSAAVIIALGKRLRLQEESLIASTLNTTDRSQLRAMLVRLLGFTLGAEALGALALTGIMISRGVETAQALWYGVFTAVSAFCNAGFALDAASLTPYQQDPLVLHVVGVLIVLGGLSPAAALAIPHVWAGRERSAQIRLVLAATVVLLGANFALIAAFEWNNTLAGLSVWDRLHNAWLQSVTLRTAGFNSIALESLRPATLLVMMASMFIGGSPGGTAGGIKTTTAAVMVFSVATAIRGGGEAELFGRRISTATVDRAAAITTLGMLSVFVTTLLLLLTQSIEPVSAVFEAVSALATVGLSLGATANLDAVGKLIVAFAMFSGRVGPLSMFAFLSARESRRNVRYPIESIDVG